MPLDWFSLSCMTHSGLSLSLSHSLSLSLTHTRTHTKAEFSMSWFTTYSDNKETHNEFDKNIASVSENLIDQEK